MWLWDRRKQISRIKREARAAARDTHDVLREVGEETLALIAWTERLEDVLVDLQDDR